MADHPIHAAGYDLVARVADAAGLARRRRRLLSQARGRVLEVGGGTGRNLAHYGRFEGLWMLEPDAAMRARLEHRLAEVDPVDPVEVLAGGLEDAPLADASFDTVVCTLVLCTVADQAGALERIRRLLRVDGRLLFLEHVAEPGLRGRIQQAATPVWQTLAAGCQLDRHTTVAMREAGFVITDCERFRLSPFDLLAGSLVQGSARPRRAAR